MLLQPLQERTRSWQQHKMKSIGTNERSSEDEIGLNIKLPKQKTSWLHLQMSWVERDSSCCLIHGYWDSMSWSLVPSMSGMVSRPGPWELPEKSAPPLRVGRNDLIRFKRPPTEKEEEGSSVSMPISGEEKTGVGWQSEGLCISQGEQGVHILLHHRPLFLYSLTEYAQHLSMHIWSCYISIHRGFCRLAPYKRRLLMINYCEHKEKKRNESGN